MELRIDRLEKLLMRDSSQDFDRLPGDTEIVNAPPDAPQNVLAANGVATLPSAQTPSTAGEVTMNLSCNLGAFPASSIMSPTAAKERINTSSRPDLVSCGVVSPDTANHYFAFYLQHLDPYMHYELSGKDGLSILRTQSSLLTTAICTVAAFCTGSQDYQGCLEIFKDEVSRRLFADKYEFDDVRALCIGALWLSEISSPLNGLGTSSRFCA